ncbi:MAG: class I SAM-dependent methyltransferase [Ginsengibacter sp.]
MTLQEAITLIQNEDIISDRKSVWADLGCGSGLFTYALANLLHEKSIVYAIDKNVSSFKKIASFKSITVKPVELDFENQEFSFCNLDGILMANSLHFVKDKMKFLEKIKSYLDNKGCFLIVEYDTEISNHWVPYPISFLSLKELFKDAGYTSVIKINERPSAFNRGNLYSAMIRNQSEGVH